MHQENLKLRFRMDWKKYATAWRSKGKILIGVVIIVIGATYFFYNLTQKTIVNLQAENFHAKCSLTTSIPGVYYRMCTYQ